MNFSEEGSGAIVRDSGVDFSNCEVKDNELCGIEAS
jgi:hypothetical protein